MNVDGSFVTRPRWLRVKESEELIVDMDIQWVHPYLANEDKHIKNKKKKRTIKIYRGDEVVKKLLENGFQFKGTISLKEIEFLCKV